MSDDNPFRSGGAGGAPGLGANEEGDLPPVDLDVMPILERCWQLLVANPALVVAAIALQMVPSLAISFFQTGLQTVMENAEPELAVALGVVYVASILVSMVVNLFVTLGITRVFSRIARGLPAEVSMLFGEGRRFFQALVAAFLYSAAATAAFLVPGLPGLAVVGMVFGATSIDNPVAWAALAFVLLLACVPTIVVGLGLQFWMYALVDQDLPAVEALRESWRLTNGYKLTIFLTNLAIGVVALVVTCVTFCLGYLVIFPLLLLSSAVIYHSLTHLQGRSGSVQPMI